MDENRNTPYDNTDDLPPVRVANSRRGYPKTATRWAHIAPKGGTITLEQYRAENP